MKRLLWLIPALLVLGFASCAKPPKAEVAAAEAAVAKAEKNADVVAYAPEALARAKTALAKMKTELDGRRYDKAKALAVEAKDAAEGAIPAAQANKDRVKAKAVELIDAVKKAVPSAEKLLASASKIRKAAFDRAAKGAELAGAKAAIAEAEAAFAASDYLKAVDKAGAAQKGLADFESAISAAVQAATRKK